MSNGYVIYEGPSTLDGSPIVVIAVGIRQKSTNMKTGAMIQTYILRSDIDPQHAVRAGADDAICGACPHRGDGSGKERSCYVTLMHGPRAVYAAYKNGRYPTISRLEAREHFAGRMVRLGTYGDPAAVDSYLWKVVLSKAEGWTGYTHQWRRPGIHAKLWAPLVMASADSEADMADAHAMGYRTFRVTPAANENIKGLEIVCPASEEMGHKTTCEECKACMGTSAKAKVSIQIAAHGTGRKYVA